MSKLHRADSFFVSTVSEDSGDHFLIHWLLFLQDGRFRKVLKVLVINCSVYAMFLSSMILRAKCFLNSLSSVCLHV